MRVISASWPLLLCLSVNAAYRWMAIPPVGERPPYSLILSPSSAAKVSELLASNPWALLGPIELDTDRWAWVTTTLIPIYWLEQILPPAGVFLAVTSLFVAVLYVCALVLSGSVRLAMTLGLIAALSTFLNYSFVYGNVMLGYLFLAWLAIAATAILAYLRTEQPKRRQFPALLAMLLPLVFAAEYWLNAAIPVILACVFAFFWARRHGDDHLGRRSLVVAGIMLAGMAIYLPVRMLFADPLVQPGFESESVVTYSHVLMMVEDMAVNYFTHLHMALSSVLPGFLTFSPSLTAYGPDVLVAEQNGYHEAYGHLIPASAMTSWRFVAGALILGFYLLGWKWICKAWVSPDRRQLVLVALFLVAATGFAIYMPIKMRPFHLTAMLGYKSLVASGAVMALVAWLIYTIGDWAPERWRKLILAGFAASIVLAAFTRPAAEIAGLHAVGLDGACDPLARFHTDTRPE